jgi:hypothetical protein
MSDDVPRTPRLQSIVERIENSVYLASVTSGQVFVLDEYTQHLRRIASNAYIYSKSSATRKQKPAAILK